jgi:hypothetical protein
MWRRRHLSRRRQCDESRHAGHAGAMIRAAGGYLLDMATERFIGGQIPWRRSTRRSASAAACSTDSRCAPGDGHASSLGHKIGASRDTPNVRPGDRRQFRYTPEPQIILLQCVLQLLRQLRAPPSDCVEQRYLLALDMCGRYDRAVDNQAQFCTAGYRPPQNCDFQYLSRIRKRARRKVSARQCSS